MRTLFTADIAHLKRNERDDALQFLADALHEEFPAYFVAETVKTDFVAALVVGDVVRDAPIPAHLNGWGHRSLTLKLVA